MDEIVKRLTQNSTWRGLILFTAGVASAIQPDHAIPIVTAAITLVGAINVVRTT